MEQMTTFDFDDDPGEPQEKPQPPGPRDPEEVLAEIDLPYEEPESIRLDAKARMEEIMASPGYTNPAFKRQNPIRWQKMHDEIGRLAVQGMSSRDKLKPIERAGLDAVKLQAEKQQTLVAQAMEVMNHLEIIGFDRSDIPRDITDFEIGGLIAQGLLAQGEHDQVLHLAGQGLSRLPQTKAGTAQRLFTEYRDCDDKAEKVERGQRLVFEIVSMLQKQAGLKRNCRGQKGTR
jgi:hypothetical protein